MAETPIKITIGEDQVEGMLADNPAARDLISQLPLTLTFSDYGGQEIVATAPEGLTMEGMPSGESAPAGTIGYYAPQQAIVLYYTDVPRPRDRASRQFRRRGLATLGMARAASCHDRRLKRSIKCSIRISPEWIGEMRLSSAIATRIFLSHQFPLRPLANTDWMYF